MKVLVTGCAGFIGMQLVHRLISKNVSVIGIDNLNDYYDVALKQARLKTLAGLSAFKIKKIDISNRPSMAKCFADEKPDRVIHLAAQAGVRYSLTDPDAYVDANLVGFTNILEGCRQQNVQHLVYASSSSVYGANKTVPFSENHSVDHPLSLYAASKRANEIMAHTYSHLFQLPTTGLRFFTVYGPWGRPDMALFIFAKAMIKGEKIDVFNNGKMTRDFTYIDDVVEAVIRLLDQPASSNQGFDLFNPIPAASNAPFQVLNIGNGNPTPLMDYIEALEVSLGVKAKKNFLPMQPGDVPLTSADTNQLKKLTGFQPNTPILTGVQKFAEWYLSYYKTSN